MIRLHGSRLRGGRVLQRTSGGRDEKWLLIKVDDDAADAHRNPASTQPESVLSRRTVGEVSREDDPCSDISRHGHAVAAATKCPQRLLDRD